MENKSVYWWVIAVLRDEKAILAGSDVVCAKAHANQDYPGLGPKNTNASRPI